MSPPQDEILPEFETARHGFPYALTSEAALFPIADAKNPKIPFEGLDRICGASGDGKHDPRKSFAQAVSGATCFAPSQTTLRVTAR